MAGVLADNNTEFWSYPQLKPVKWCGNEIWVKQVTFDQKELFPFKDDQVFGRQFAPRICCGCSLKDFFLSLENLVNCSKCSSKKIQIKLECVKAGTDFDGDFCFYTHQDGKIQLLKDVFEFEMGFIFDESEDISSRTQRNKKFEQALVDDNDAYVQLTSGYMTMYDFDVWKKCISNWKQDKTKCVAPDCTRSLKGECFSQISPDLRHFIDFIDLHKCYSALEFGVPDSSFETRLILLEKGEKKVREHVLVKQTVGGADYYLVLGKTFARQLSTNTFPNCSLQWCNVDTADLMTISGLFVSPLISTILQNHCKTPQVDSLEKLCQRFVTLTIVQREKTHSQVICVNLLNHIENSLLCFVCKAVTEEIVRNCKELLGLLSYDFESFVQCLNVSTEKKTVSFKKCKQCRLCKTQPESK